MRTSALAAITVVVVLGLWMVSGLFKSEETAEDTAKKDSTDSTSQTTDALMAVEVQVLNVETIDREISLHGQLEPLQHLFLKAETSGTVEHITQVKGARVKLGDAILNLDQGGRQYTLTEAQARVKTARSEYEAAQTLRRQRLQSQLQLEQAEAALEAAVARLAAIQLDISNTTITAPFDAVVNDLPIDVGALVERGDIVAELVDDSAFKVSAQVAQQSLTSLRVGQTLSVELITGESLPGKLTFISSVADSQTRSFRIEALVDNKTGATAAGISASMHIPVEQLEATFISPSTLSLGDDGELGVKAVNDQDQVVFLPIALVSTSLDGAWVSGIAQGTRVITLGQGFVNVGETVEPQVAANSAASGAR